MDNYFQEADLTAKDRKKLKDSQFGLPEEHKYPLTDASHVRSAMAYFRYCPADKRKKLAKRILSAANKYGVEVSKDSMVYKAAHESAYLYNGYNNYGSVILEADDDKNKKPAVNTVAADTAPSDYTANDNANNNDDTPTDFTADNTNTDNNTQQGTTPPPADNTQPPEDNQPAQDNPPPANNDADTPPADATQDNDTPQPAEQNADNDAPADFTANDANDTGTDQSNADDNPTDFTTNDDSGNNNDNNNVRSDDVNSNDQNAPTDNTDDSGADDDAPADFTDDNSDDSGDDTDDSDGNDAGTDSTDTDDGGVDNAGDTVNSDIQNSQQSAFSNLSSSQLRIKTNNIKQSFIDLFNDVVDTMDRLVVVNKNGDNIETLNFVNNSLSDLKEMLRDSLTDSFDTRSLVENQIVLQRFIAIYSMIITIIEKMVTKRRKEDKDK